MWDRESGGGKEHMYTYGWIHVDVQQKLTQYCKAIILQLKISELKKRNGSNKDSKKPK